MEEAYNKFGVLLFGHALRKETHPWEGVGKWSAWKSLCVFFWSGGGGGGRGTFIFSGNETKSLDLLGQNPLRN